MTMIKTQSKLDSLSIEDVELIKTTIQNLIESHSCAHPDEKEVSSKANEVEKIITEVHDDLCKARELENQGLSFFEVRETTTVVNDYKVLASSYDEALNMISCPEDYEEWLSKNPIVSISTRVIDRELD